jgi:hypothetical protein
LHSDIALKFNHILRSRALHALVFGELVRYACMPVLVVDSDMTMCRMRCGSTLIMQNLRRAHARTPEIVSAFAVRSLREYRQRCTVQAFTSRCIYRDSQN